MNMTVRRILFTVIAMLIVIAAKASESVSVPKTILLCGTEWPPFLLTHNGSFDEGISVDVIRAAFARIHVPVRLVPLSWIVCVQKLKSGAMDGAIDAFPTDHGVHGVNSSSFYPLALFVEANSPTQDWTWEQMRGKKIGMVRGYVYGPTVQSYKDWVRIDAESDQQLIVWLQRKRADLVLTDMFAGPILAEKLGVKVRALAPLVETLPLYLNFHPSQKELAMRYDQVIADMISDGTMDAIYRKYLSIDFHEARRLWGPK